jgi:hypothetical protein
MTDHTIPTEEPKLSRSPRRAIAIVLAVLLVSWYCFPAAVAGWTEDHCPDGPWCAAFQTIADSVDAASRSVGIAGAFEGWREALRQALGIDAY